MSLALYPLGRLQRGGGAGGRDSTQMDNDLGANRATFRSGDHVGAGARVGAFATGPRTPQLFQVVERPDLGWIKEGKNAIKWTRLSCRKFRHNAVRLQLHALAYNLGNFMRTLVLPDAVEQWSLTTLREKLVKIGAKIVRHGRYIVSQMAEVAIPRDLFADILRRIDRLRTTPLPT